jgi:hypothetical protein
MLSRDKVRRRIAPWQKVRVENVGDLADALSDDHVTDLELT